MLYLSDECSVAVLYLSDGCSVAVLYLSDGCSVAVLYLSDECSVAVLYLSDGCSVAVLHLSDGYSVVVLYLSDGCSLEVFYQICRRYILWNFSENAFYPKNRNQSNFLREIILGCSIFVQFLLGYLIFKGDTIQITQKELGKTLFYSNILR